MDRRMMEMDALERIRRAHEDEAVKRSYARARLSGEDLSVVEDSLSRLSLDGYRRLLAMSDEELLDLVTVWLSAEAQLDGLTSSAELSVG